MYWRLSIATVLVLSLFVAMAFGTQTRPKSSGEPFGGTNDVAFAKKVWSAMKGYNDWKLTSPVYKGGSPHGKWVRLYSSYTTVDGQHYPIPACSLVLFAARFPLPRQFLRLGDLGRRHE